MTPEELAKKFPKLYHVTRPEALPLIKSHGLLSTSALLDLFEILGDKRLHIEAERRPKTVCLNHPKFGNAWISDNKPLYLKSLIQCLDDDLSAADWLYILNRRVFFWPRVQNAEKLRNAENYRNETRLILEIDTLRFAQKYSSIIEICPFNSGAASRIPARRGLNTFSPLEKFEYYDWRRLRPTKSLDTIHEIAVIDSIPDILSFASIKSV